VGDFEGGLTYTLSLRANVKFHDGTSLTAEAVKFCFERQMLGFNLLGDGLRDALDPRLR
jgi:ABC-type transport system substrate-binding protein